MFGLIVSEVTIHSHLSELFLRRTSWWGGCSGATNQEMEGGKKREWTGEIYIPFNDTSR